MDLKDPTMENYLAHYGVLGMKWGVRNAESKRRLGGPSPRSVARNKKRQAKTAEKARLNRPSPKYTKLDRSVDREALGNRGVKRVNRSVNKGRSVNQARLIEGGRQTAQSMLLAGGLGLVTLDIATNGMLRNVVLNKFKGGLQNLADTKTARDAGKNAVNQLLTTDYISTLKPTKKRRGSYKITNM